MLIECTIQRLGGSTVELGGETYHFSPDETGAHVAEVCDPAHIKRLLSIDAYRVAGGGDPVVDNEMTAERREEEARVLEALKVQGEMDDAASKPVVEPTKLMEELAAEYKQLAGKNPHYSWNAAKLQSKVDELRAKQAQ